MSFTSLEGRLYKAMVGSELITYVTFPTGAAAVALTGGKSYAYGAWAAIAAAGLITADVWLVGVELSNATALDDFLVQIGEGVGPTGFAIVPCAGNDYTAVAWPLAYPRRIASGNAISGRTANASAAAFNTIAARVVTAWGI